MTTSAPFSFHPLPYLSSYLALSGDNDSKTRVQRKYSLKDYSVCFEEDTSVVFTNRPVEIGETVYLRFGPDTRYNFSIGFYIYVGFTKCNPSTLRSSCIRPNIPGFWLSKLYVSNETSLHYTLDPSGIIDFGGTCIGYEPFKKIELGEVTRPLWAVIGVPEYPFYVELVPPPPDAKPIQRKNVQGQPQDTECVPESTSKSSTVQEDPSEGGPDLETSQNTGDKSLNNDSEVTTPLPNETVEVISPQNTDLETSVPIKTIKESTSPRQSSVISTENETTPESFSPSTNRENSVPNDTLSEVSHASTEVQEIPLSSNHVTEILSPNNPVQENMAPETSPLNATVKGDPLPNDDIQQDPPKPERASSSLDKEETSLKSAQLNSTIPETSPSNKSLPSYTIPKNSLSSYTAARNVFLNKSVPVTSSPKNTVTNISVSASSTPNKSIQKDSIINVPVNSKLSTTKPINSSHTETDPVNPSQNIVVTINSSPNSVIVVSPETNGISEFLERCTVPVSSLHNINAMTSEQNGSAIANPSQNAVDSVHPTAENPDEHTQITINEGELHQQNIEEETLLQVPSEQTDRRPNTKRRYCIIFSVAMILVVAVALILYFTL